MILPGVTPGGLLGAVPDGLLRAMPGGVATQRPSAPNPSGATTQNMGSINDPHP